MSRDLEAVKRDLEAMAHRHGGFVELRYHRKRSRSAGVENGRVEIATARRREGVGVRVIEDACFGYASCGSADLKDVAGAIDRAILAARASAGRRRERLAPFPAADLVRGHFEGSSVGECDSKPFEAKVNLARTMESRARSSAASISSATCVYTESFEEKAIVTSDGAAASYRLVRPEFRVSAVAQKNGERQVGTRTIGATGGWDCLFARHAADQLAEQSARTAIDLLAAKRPEGGRHSVILAPSIVGLLVHEAIGHTVEADFVSAGSVAAGKIGQRVASDLVTLCDSGQSELVQGAAGSIPVDDEGVRAGRTVIIRNGMLESYLHDRESAARFGVAPTGNARAFEYSDPTLIRMRNTYLEPGTSTLEQMIATTPDGFLLEGPRNGQADATGEFMFGVERAYRIRDGKLHELLRGVTLSGIAFDVLMTVDAVSREFAWDLGAGYCGKGQLAKVDAGGPYVRCQALLGGDQ